MTEDFDIIESKIISELKFFLKEVESVPNLGNGYWTKRIKKRIGDLGISLGYKVATGGFRNEFENEWLYDLVWYEEDNEGCLIRIPLIVESEWDKSYKGIKYDFEKLLVGNAEKRLMICQCKQEDYHDLLLKFENAVTAFRENYGDRFLFAILDSVTEEWMDFKTFTKTVN